MFSVMGRYQILLGTSVIDTFVFGTVVTKRPQASEYLFRCPDSKHSGVALDLRTHKFEETDVLPERSHTACKSQHKRHSTHNQDNPHRVEAVHPRDLRQVQQHALQRNSLKM